MALTGQAKTDYQRDYMRRRRAKLAQSAGPAQSKRPPEDEQAEPSERDQDDLIERLQQTASRALGLHLDVARQIGHRDRVRFDPSREEFTRDRDFAAKIRGAWVSRGSLRMASIARATAAVR
jgi:hypothetical protein